MVGMDLHIVRESLRNVLKDRDLSLKEFAEKHDVPKWWLFRFHQGKVTNPRLNSLERLQRALETESGAER